MDLHFVFRHMEVSEAIKEYATSRIGEKLEKFPTKDVNANVTISVESGEHRVHVHAKGGDGFNFDADARTTDMQASVDLIVDRLVQQFKKHKEILKQHKGNTSVRDLPPLEDDAAQDDD